MSDKSTRRRALTVGFVGTWLGTALQAPCAWAQASPSAAAAPPGAGALVTSPLVKTPPPTLQDGATMERVSLTDAVRRAMARNPTSLVASREIDRAEALLREARSSSLPTLTANGTYTRLDGDRVQGSGVVVARKEQLSANLMLTVPIVQSQRWVAWSHASTSLDVTRASALDTKRQAAISTARAYLAVVVQKRQVDIIERALATARAHAEYAHTRLAGGIGNRVDAVRAAQQVATTQAQLATTYTALARTREALGILLGEEHPVDALDEAKLPEPPATRAELDDARSQRSDLALARQKVRAAEQVQRDSWADYMPQITGQFQPFLQDPPTLMTPKTGWQALLLLSIPLYDGGLRYGQKDERTALVAQARTQYDGLERQSKADVRIALEAAKRAEEALGSALDAAQLAHQALELATLAYGAGESTNIEVIDAERQARDADTAAAIAEDSVRQARLELLVAAGRFP